MEGQAGRRRRARAPIAGADWYYHLFSDLCTKVDVWRTTYHHPFDGGAHAVVEWFKGSGLRPFLEPLDLGRARGLPHALYRCGRKRLSSSAGRRRAVAVPPIVHRGDAVGS